MKKMQANKTLHRNSRCPRPFNVSFILIVLSALHHHRPGYGWVVRCL